MVNEATGNTMFEMSQLPQEVSRAIATLQPGEISQPFVMRDASSNRDVVAIVKLTNHIYPNLIPNKLSCHFLLGFNKWTDLSQLA